MERCKRFGVYFILKVTWRAVVISRTVVFKSRTSCGTNSLPDVIHLLAPASVRAERLRRTFSGRRPGKRKRRTAKRHCGCAFKPSGCRCGEHVKCRRSRELIVSVSRGHPGAGVSIPCGQTALKFVAPLLGKSGFCRTRFWYRVA
jgi:hypothetical protein